MKKTINFNFGATKFFANVLFISALIFVSVPIFAQKKGKATGQEESAQDFYSNLDGKGSVVLIYKSELLNGLPDGSDKWVAKSIKENVIHDLTVYGKMKCIDMEEMKNIRDVQKKSETALFDQNSPIEMGKLVNAKKYIIITTTRVGASYNMNLRIVDAETGIAQSFSTKKTYDSPEAYVNQAHYENISFVLNGFDITVTSDTENKIKIAVKNAEKETQIALESKASHKDELEKLRLENERRAMQAEAERRQEEEQARIRAENAKKEKARAEAAKFAANPFVGHIFTCEIQNGSRQDSYKLDFKDETLCTITVTSLGASGEQTYTRDGRYYFREGVFSLNADMSASPVRHVKKVSWKAVPTFGTNYTSFTIIIPSSSMEGAKTVKADFFRTK